LGRVDGELVMRAYTPSSSDDQLGYFELVVKIYFANQHPRFPEGGQSFMPGWLVWPWLWS
jgi:hypothetical protein